MLCLTPEGRGKGALLVSGAAVYSPSPPSGQPLPHPLSLSLPQAPSLGGALQTSDVTSPPQSAADDVVSPPAQRRRRVQSPGEHHMTRSVQSCILCWCVSSKLSLKSYSFPVPTLPTSFPTNFLPSLSPSPLLPSPPFLLPSPPSLPPTPQARPQVLVVMASLCSPPRPRTSPPPRLTSALP